MSPDCFQQRDTQSAVVRPRRRRSVLECFLRDVDCDEIGRPGNFFKAAVLDAGNLVSQALFILFIFRLFPVLFSIFL